MSSGPLSNLAQLTDATTHRFSSFDRSGGNRDHTDIPAGKTVALADIEGAGKITHIWITLSSPDPMARRNLVLRMYWDSQAHPSVECPIGDFFGQGWGMKYNFSSLPLAAAPKGGNALVCYFPMPFSAGARITVENQSEIDCDALYYYVDFERHHGPSAGVGRFHAWYNQELTKPESSDGDRENEWALLGPEPKNPTDKDNYLFCDIAGEGHYVGVNYYVNCPTPIWYGEGDDMFCVDGEEWPFSMHGTGTEDYFNMSWCPDEHYLHPYFGCARAPGRLNDDARFGWLGRTHNYRFHLEDPIRFKKSLRASIEHGHANVLTLEMASVAYWYQSLPAKRFPTLASPADRIPRSDLSAVDIHRMRDAWRVWKSGGKLWGNEP